MKITIRTNVVNGNLKRNRNLIIDAINSFEGKDCLITLERPKKSRSNNQNRFYWGAFVPLIQQGLKDATGELRSSESIHYNILLPLFAPKNEIVNTDTGESLFERLGSSDLTTTQFFEYILDIQKWAAEFLGIDIPNPNEETMLNFEDT